MSQDKMLSEFIRESNRIEGEDNLPIDVEALKRFLANDLTEENLHEYHKSISWNKEWSGKWRTCNVWVWNYTPPSPSMLTNRMNTFFSQIDLMDAWTAHNEFERIHPYQDFNWRLWRAIWLHKMVEYNPNLGFLHSYYYQSLSNYGK